MSANHNQLLSKAQELENSLSKETIQAEQFSKDLSSAHQEIDSLRMSLQTSTTQNYEREKEVATLREKVLFLESSERSREDEMKRIESELNGIKEQKSRLEETVEVYRIQNTKLDESLKKAMDEIGKVTCLFCNLFVPSNVFIIIIIIILMEILGE